ncbi:MAG: hypothetical protein WC389_17940 [Lutibacter sp.]|jgi:transposase
MYQSPVKNIEHYFEASYLSELYQDVILNEKRVGALLRKIGTERDKVVNYAQSFIREEDHILIDVTHLISHSQYIDIARYGYNSQNEYDPQINLMFMFSSELQTPVFYRVLPGNIREVSAFKHDWRQRIFLKIKH